MLNRIEHGEILELRLDRPPANALNPELIAAIADAVTAAPAAGARAIVISGSPGRFSGGLDVPALLQLDRAAMEATLRHFFRMLRALAASPVPIVAAITGHAPAGGAVISIFCDARIMAEGDFRIGLNEVQVGLSLPQVIHTALVRVVGERQAERLSVGGLLVPAGEALRIGLVDELVPAESVVERALELCRDLLALPPKAMASTRALSRSALVTAFDRQQQDTYDRFVDDWFGAETQGAMQALVSRLLSKSKAKSPA
ncbi:MAG: enoyl-CoA hydratase/isomerase family protein [Thermoanaerobaculia bacterium]